jgi:hypothetical protein
MNIRVRLPELPQLKSVLLHEGLFVRHSATFRLFANTDEDYVAAARHILTAVPNAELYYTTTAPPLEEHAGPFTLQRIVVDTPGRLAALGGPAPAPRIEGHALLAICSRAASFQAPEAPPVFAADKTFPPHARLPAATAKAWLQHAPANDFDFPLPSSTVRLRFEDGQVREVCTRSTLSTGSTARAGRSCASRRSASARWSAR